ncbi:MAG: DEAD/DEAH box helicase [Colwellia sp.]|nr:DEAD/DEAH box helicase [Colwellia sp.]MCW8864638.1 DEAD/DEAH box helicase [Colwellia sp.]
MKFSNFALDEQINIAIEEMGYKSATAIQQKAIPLILAKHDLMARAQTGTGKTAAFALPLLNNLLNHCGEKKDVNVLVLVPTRELAQQVNASFNNYGKYCQINSVMAYGGVSVKAQVEQLAKGADVLVATPGRLIDLLVHDHVSLKSIKALVLDEADRLLDLGFKQEIEKIFEYLPTHHQTLLFSATFDEAIFDLSKKILHEPELVSIDDKNTVATGVEQIVYTVDEEKKRELTSYLIGSKNWQQVLIFTRTKKAADELAKEMCKDGIKTLALHGDKSQGTREKALAEFKQGKCRALVATDVAARGLDIRNLQYVINFELPYIAEDYVHRIGRTARAGKSGQAISLLSPDEEWLLSAVEETLDYRLLQQWYPGYEPDLSKVLPVKKSGGKQQARKRLLSKNDGKKKRKNNSSYKRR